MKTFVIIIFILCIISCTKEPPKVFYGRFHEIYSTYAAKKNRFNYDNLNYEVSYKKIKTCFSDTRVHFIHWENYIFRNYMFYNNNDDSVEIQKHIYKHNNFNDFSFVIEYSKLLTDSSSIGYTIFIDYRGIISTEFSTSKYIAWKNKFKKNTVYREKNYFWGIQNGIIKQKIIGAYLDTVNYQKFYNVGFSTALMITNMDDFGIFKIAPLYKGVTIRDKREIYIDYKYPIHKNEFYESIIMKNFPELLR